ncbi:D-alanyl-D-alanine carboxypeptidase/D-alanyl-D-alanine-endopeptidase [candidate division WOR-3 bacterium]|nr:D-alanyl-D-alanine carboxypeptidase/D-alanyl-D-alanine-endopeptidase [candidate division WOR-3 bacterium]
MLILLLVASLSIDSILGQPELEHAHVGMIVLNLDEDSVIYANNYQKNMVPASNLKIVTSAAALTFLGSDFRFKTRLAIKGEVRRGELQGDLVVIGGGDPSFSLENLEAFVMTIREHDISRIDGNIILIDGYFTQERLPIGWAWHYLDARYAAEISAISMNRNVVNVRIEATRLGAYADVSIEPLTAYVKLINTMITKPGDDSIIIFRPPDENTIYVDGGIGFNHTRNIEVAVKDPAMFVGQYLKERLSESNIEFSGRCIRGADLSIYDRGSDYIIVDSILSVSLSDIIREINTESVNLYAEAVLKTLGSHYLKEGSFKAGVSIVKEFLRRCGADTSLVELYDGSGLSRYNLISPYNIMLVLRYMYHSKLFDGFYELMAGPGEGTLENRFNSISGVMRAKTGTLDAISCLSGYLKLNNQNYCFSMMFNNFVCPRKKIEKIQEDILKELKVFLEEA